MTWLARCVVPPVDALGVDAERARRIEAVLPIVEAAAQREGVPLDLVLGVIWTESRFNPSAGSHAGAVGLMQIMPKTWDYIRDKQGLPRSVPRTDPEANINAGTWLLARLLEKFGSVKLALAAYNAGAGNVQKYGGVPPFSETQNYVRAVPRAAENFRIAREERCEGLTQTRQTWQRTSRGTSVRRSPRATAAARPQTQAAGGGGLGVMVLAALVAGLAWEGSR